MLVNIHKLIVLQVLFLAGLTAMPARAQQAPQVFSLQACLDTALVQNKHLKMSRNNLALGTEKQREARANLLPKVNLTSEYKYFIDLPYQLMPQSVFGGPEGQFKEAQFGVPHNLNAHVQATVPVYNPFIHGAIQTAGIGSELAELQHWKTAEQVLFDVATHYYHAQILHHQLSFIDSNLVNGRKLLATMKLLQANLLARGTDVNKVKLQVEQLNTQKDRIGSQYNQVLNSLKIAMGISVNKSIAIDAQVAISPPGDYALVDPVDMQIANKQQGLAASELATLKASRLPSVSLSGSYGTTGFGYSNKTYDFLKFYPVGFAGIQVSYPLFNGTVTQSKIRQQKLALKNSELQVALLSDQQTLKTDNAMQQREVAQKAIGNTLAQVQLAQSVYGQTVLQQKQGTASLTDILLADNALHEAQQANLSAMIDYLKADLELKKTTGNLLMKQ
ncbi:MAG: TolC family protein [Adhaeribacter sp.]